MKHEDSLFSAALNLKKLTTEQVSKQIKYLIMANTELEIFTRTASPKMR